MKLGLVAGYSPAEMSVPMDLILEAENLGFDSVWTSEAWGSDAVTPAAWILARTSRINVGTAIIQMGARAPACAAMTAMTLDAMSGGRFILGVGPSGPQVIEGWYGVPYGRPLTRTREYISIIRKILARTEPLTHEGEHYQIPYQGEGASGLGKPLRSILHGNPDASHLHRRLHRERASHERRSGGRGVPGVDEPGSLRPLRERRSTRASRGPGTARVSIPSRSRPSSRW